MVDEDMTQGQQHSKDACTQPATQSVSQSLDHRQEEEEDITPLLQQPGRDSVREAIATGFMTFIWSAWEEEEEIVQKITGFSTPPAQPRGNHFS